MQKTFYFKELGLEAEVGKVAKQADGAVWLKCGDNVVLATAVASKEPKEFMGFFPLTVEYRERTSAAGRIPGGFIKREGKLSDHEVLVSRLIDRPIRPLFPKYYFNEVQVLATVYSSDGKFPTSILSVLASSLALTISEIPFDGPVGAVCMSRVNGKWEFNVDYQDSSVADSSIVVAGTKDGICMVEGHCNNLSEEEFIDLLLKAEQQIKKLVAWQEGIAKELAVIKQKVEYDEIWEKLEVAVKSYLDSVALDDLFVKTKKERNAVMMSLKKGLFEKFEQQIKNGEVSSHQLIFLFESELKKRLPDLISKKGQRLDLRKYDEVRPLFAEVASLPCVHGSALFQRGETQVLASLTLGTPQDVQLVETLVGGLKELAFILHYNFPPFATGEVKPMRGPSRREIGHGSLVARSFKNVIPPQKEFPYTIRTVADVLESNGSSSMASVCATTMALMDAGVPIKDAVAGIAMGLMVDSDGNKLLLTDILGIEDGFGLMDFKVSGTEKGIMAVQLDVKAQSGFDKGFLKEVLERAKKARLQILEYMKKVIPSPRKEISSLAPRVSYFQIDRDKIGVVIGPGGKNIKEIIAKTGSQVDIEDDGTVKIYSKDVSSAEETIKWIKTLAGEITVGDVYWGEISGIADYGVFVELIPGRSGLIHVSAIDKSLLKELGKKFKVGDKIKVKVVGYDRETGRIKLVAPALAGNSKK